MGDDYPLSVEHIEQCHNEGFLVLEQLFDDGDLASVDGALA